MVRPLDRRLCRLLSVLLRVWRLVPLRLGAGVAVRCVRSPGSDHVSDHPPGSRTAGVGPRRPPRRQDEDRIAVRRRRRGACAAFVAGAVADRSSLHGRARNADGDDRGVGGFALLVPEPAVCRVAEPAARTTTATPGAVARPHPAAAGALPRARAAASLPRLVPHRYRPVPRSDRRIPVLEARGIRTTGRNRSRPDGEPRPAQRRDAAAPQLDSHPLAVVGSWTAYRHPAGAGSDYRMRVSHRPVGRRTGAPARSGHPGRRLPRFRQRLPGTACASGPARCARDHTAVAGRAADRSATAERDRHGSGQDSPAPPRAPTHHLGKDIRGDCHVAHNDGIAGTRRHRRCAGISPRPRRADCGAGLRQQCWQSHCWTSGATFGAPWARSETASIKFVVPSRT